MEGLLKATLTAMTVLLVVAAARRCGHRLAGVVAALPTITAPTLAWLAEEHGAAFAASAAVGSISACAMLAVFALFYALAARRGGVLVATVCGLLGAFAMALPAAAASARLADALVLALGCCTLAAAVFVAIPQAVKPAQPRDRSSRSLLPVAVAAGALTAVAATLGPALGGFATGLLASLPLISGVVAAIEHAAGGHAAATRFLRGYVWGLFGKAAFGAVFVLLAAPLGVPAALALGCACACLVSTWPLRRVAWFPTPTSHRAE